MGSFSSHVRTVEEIQEWLIAELSDRLGVSPDEIDSREPFMSYGLSSRGGVELSGDLGDWLECEISPTIAWDYPCIADLAAHLGVKKETAPLQTPEEEQAPAAHQAATGTDEPIAIIGIGNRFPGASGPEEFWQLLQGGVDAISELPAERAAMYSLLSEHSDGDSKVFGGFLKDIDQFDPSFFGISPREASRMDPQQRLLLQVTWEAFEDAGLPVDQLQGSKTGVFVGISSSDYARMQLDHPEQTDLYAITGTALSIAANRISYLLDFQGPSVAVDTACSSSLVALHLACQSLRSGESTLAVAGGVNLLLSPIITGAFGQAGMMAEDGRCKTFDSRADGYVRGEGAGVVVLKPLSNALADGDDIYALVQGSGINQDGRSNGLTAPNRYSQEDLIRDVCRRAGVSPGAVQYIEAHGTGTSLGDPIEVKALGAVLAENRPANRPCLLGSVKSNIGHLESAAGIAGVIKVALSMKKGEIPQTLHYQAANPQIPFDELPVRVQEAHTPWPSGNGPKLAGVSSFGFGGTNAHVLLTEAPATEQNEQKAPHPAATGNDRAFLLPLSARSKEALRQLASAYRSFLKKESSLPLADIAYSAQTKRVHHTHRLACLAPTAEELLHQLDAFTSGDEYPGLSTGRAVPDRKQKPVFVYTGQGAQWWSMGRDLFDEEPVFRAAIEECDLLLRHIAGWSLIDELKKDEDASRLNETEVAQPAIFAIQVALTRLWASAGIKPSAVIGHSLGEVAAAYAAGAYSLADAIRVIHHRSRLMQRMTGHGKMASVELPLEKAKQAIANCDGLTVGASNSLTSVVLSGDPAALEEVVAALKEQGIDCRFLPVNYAFHSPQMDPILGELEASLAELMPAEATVPLYSTVFGQACTGRELTAAYWVKNVRGCVQFAEGMASLIDAGHDTFIEIGPHPALAHSIKQCLREKGVPGTVLHTMRRKTVGRAEWQSALAALYTLGYPIEWGVLQTGDEQFVRLPTYAWQRERCWIDFEPAWQAYARSQKTARLIRSARPGGDHLWEMEWNGSSIENAEAFSLDLLQTAGKEMFAKRDSQVVAWAQHAPLRLEKGATLQVILTSLQDAKTNGCLYSRAAGSQDWTLHLSGTIELQGDATEETEPGATPEEAAESQPDGLYSALAILLEAKPEERQHLLIEYLRSKVANVLKLAPSKLSVDTPLNSLGLDSIMAVELKNRLQNDLGIVISLVKFLQGPTIEQVAGELLPDLPGSLADLEDDGEPEGMLLDANDFDLDLLGNLDSLSDDEVEAMLSQMLAEKEGI